MGSGGDDVGVPEGRRDNAGRDEAADVRHVGQQPRAGRVGDLLHAGVVDVAGVRAGPSHNQLFSSNDNSSSIGGGGGSSSSSSHSNGEAIGDVVSKAYSLSWACSNRRVPRDKRSSRSGSHSNREAMELLSARHTRFLWACSNRLSSTKQHD